ncbi:MAG: RDD family protein [Acidobacteriia bacterium]|nr:RDD family protein [Terriglobia bacterium]
MPENFIFCSKCGTQNPATAQFCQSCGLTLSSGLAPNQAAAPARAYAAAPPAAYVAAPAVPYGGFWIRFLAHLIDHVILSAVAAPLFFIMVLPAIIRIAHEAEQNQEPPSPELIVTILSSIFIYIALAFVGQWLYEALLTSSSWQGTIGKRVLRLKVVDEAGNRIGFGRSTGRFFAKILSSIFFYIGFIMIGFTDRKRGLHDMLAGTVVMKY